ncbi:MAG: peroxide stress protein YaaA [Pseudomonadales bacterium]|nr:peroxide stress protein YaaA [Pseudomonadales bacterium]
MQIVISPAKTLDFESPSITDIHSQAQFLDRSQLLINNLSKRSVQDIASLMRLSDKLAALNVARFGSWSLPFTPDNAKQAVLAFKGDVYTGLDAESLSDEQLAFAQKHLRILSGLYGLLQPLDLIQPYRLEMGTKLKHRTSENLYQFWGERLTKQLNLETQQMSEQLLEQNSDASELPEATLINLASNEYFKALQVKKLKARLITPIFKDQKNGNYKIISFFAKKARGMMVRYIIDNRITDAQQLKDFNYAGYYYSPELSNSNDWVFLREEQQA